MHAYSVTLLSGQVLVGGCKLGGEIQYCPEDWTLLALNALSGAQRPRTMVKARAWSRGLWLPQADCIASDYGFDKEGQS